MSFFDIIRMLMPLLIITALLGGVLWYVKKFSYQAKSKTSLGIDIKVLSSKMILPKKYISVIKVKDRLLVLGVSDSSINLLKEFDVSPEDEITFESSNKENFMDILKKNLNFK